MRPNIRNTQLLMGVALLSACATPIHPPSTLEVGSADDRLAQLGAQKSAATNPAELQTTLAQLRGLGTEAAAAARIAGAPGDRIALYRVAATAAWQAGDPQVVEFARAGDAACADHWQELPRDCSLLRFIPDLAATDETTTAFNALDSTTASTADALAVLARYEQVAEGMIARRSAVVAIAPTAVAAEFDARLDDLVCVKYGINAIGLAITAGADIDGACRLGNLRVRAAQTGAALPSCPGSAPRELVENCR
jgi:hypothetical protein